MPVSQSPYEDWIVETKDHPGSTSDEIANEPDWSSLHHDHYTGYKNKHGRRPGLIFENEHEDGGGYGGVENFQKDKERASRVKRKADSNNGKLVNWQDAIKSEKNVSLYHPEGHPYGWRYVLNFTEDEIKNKQEWPANVRKREKEAQEKEKEESGQDAKQSSDKAKKQQNGDYPYFNRSDPQKGTQSDNQKGNDQQKKHENDQQECSQREDDNQRESEEKDDRSKFDKLRDKYTLQELALLRAVQHEREYIGNLKTNDGRGQSGIKRNRTDTTLSEDDQFTPDNWIPRSKDLIRLTGKHPFNAEPDLRLLFSEGFITPNEIHYVRSHGAVPRLLWEYHQLEIIPFRGDKRTFSMDDLKNNFDWINIPVLIGCDNGRRKELNMVKRTHGFNWGPGAAGCAFWKGPLLRDVLLAAGVPERLPYENEKRYWVHLQGADNPGSSLYETSIPFEYVMDPTNDVMLAYEMNDVPLPPDHGYPIRTVIPGYVGGRQVKWLQKVWVNDKENDSYWHIWDNRMVPLFVTSQGDELGKAMFHHPDTALYEQYLNSIITRPSQGETIVFKDIKQDSQYRLQGFAFNGRGDEVKRVEVTLDGGQTWLYCIRQFPNAPIRHADAIRVRAWDVKMMTQPEVLNWNLMGSMNNVQYVVKPEIAAKGSPQVLFRHPVEPGNGDGGWAKESAENQISDAEKKVDAPKKQFTREEIEKHDKEDDCWIVVDGKVYDATSVLSWHPGGAAPVMMHAGAVHYATSEEFSSVHDDHAYEKLNGKCMRTSPNPPNKGSDKANAASECILGTVTDKAMALIQQTKENQDNPDARVPPDQALFEHQWVQGTLSKREWVSEDTAVYTFKLPDGRPFLGLGTCQHVQMGFHLRDRMLIRSYTPTRPVLPQGSDIHTPQGGDQEDLYDGSGTFQLTVKTYFPDSEQPGGALSNILTAMPIGEQVELRGPTGDVIYLGQGKFSINGQERSIKRVSMVVGGTGLTPGYSLIARVSLDSKDKTEIRVIDANKSEEDILLREDLDRFTELSKGRLKVTHVLSHPSETWEGLKGHVDEDIMKKNLFPPQGNENLVLLCGPPPMIQKAAIPALEDWGYDQKDNIFGL